jgi:hypothetical protein
MHWKKLFNTQTSYIVKGKKLSEAIGCCLRFDHTCQQWSACIVMCTIRKALQQKKYVNHEMGFWLKIGTGGEMIPGV